MFSGIPRHYRASLIVARPQYSVSLMQVSQVYRQEILPKSKVTEIMTLDYLPIPTWYFRHVLSFLNVAEFEFSQIHWSAPQLCQNTVSLICLVGVMSLALLRL